MPCTAASPRLSTATATADHSGDRVVDSLMRSGVQHRDGAH